MTIFVVALPAEARPLIAHYRLEPVKKAPRATYRGDGKSLVISGVGKAASAAATALLADEPSRAWLNVGIAGHRDRPPGELVRAHRISDGVAGERFYPTLLGLDDIATAGVTTVDVPETTFATNDVFEMEASGFYETALSVSTTELVQCTKIVSDNRTRRATGLDGHQLTAKRVSALVERNLDAIDAIVTHLESLAAELAFDLPDPEPFLDTWHFTTSERRRLTRLLRRLTAFDERPSVADVGSSDSASAVLRALDERLRDLAKEQTEF